jgi:hypothetical protein
MIISVECRSEPLTDSIQPKEPLQKRAPRRELPRARLQLTTVCSYVHGDRVSEANLYSRLNVLGTDRLANYQFSGNVQFCQYWGQWTSVAMANILKCDSRAAGHLIRGLRMCLSS